MTLKPEVRIAARLRKYPEFSRAWHAWKNEADPEKKDKIRVAMVRRFGEPFVSGQKLRAGFTRRGRGVVRPMPAPLCYPSARGAKAARCREEAEARLAWGCNYVLPESEIIAVNDAKVGMGLKELGTKLNPEGISFERDDGWDTAWDRSMKELEVTNYAAMGLTSSSSGKSTPIDLSGIEPQAAIAYTVSEAATELGISPSSVRSRLAAGSLKGEKDQAGKWTVFGPLT